MTTEMPGQNGETSQPAGKNPEKVTLSSFNDISANGGTITNEKTDKPNFYLQKHAPDIEQDGGHEIHPDLKGITFNFWMSNKEGINGVAVNYSGNAENAPWAYHLTGKVFQDFTVAKKWLREEATRLSQQHKKEQDDRDQANEIRNQMNN